jgi:hypothetical protein
MIHYHPDTAIRASSMAWRTRAFASSSCPDFDFSGGQLIKTAGK